MTWKDLIRMIWPACIVAMMIVFFWGPQLFSWLAGQAITITMRTRLASAIAIVAVGLFITAGGIIVIIIRKGG